MRAGSRIVRINELLKRELGSLITSKNIAPSNSVLVSVTEVKTSSDLRHAVVFVSVFGGDNETANEVLRTLKRRRGEFQHAISLVVSFKYTPVLKFELDLRIAAGDRIYEQLLEDKDNN